METSSRPVALWDGRARVPPTATTRTARAPASHRPRGPAAETFTSDPATGRFGHIPVRVARPTGAHPPLGEWCVPFMERHRIPETLMGPRPCRGSVWTQVGMRVLVGGDRARTDGKTTIRSRHRRGCGCSYAGLGLPGLRSATAARRTWIIHDQTAGGPLTEKILNILEDVRARTPTSLYRGRVAGRGQGLAYNEH
jgi:hypothetical protein